MGVKSGLVKPNAPHAKKRFGQHFLRDTGVIERIIRWIRPAPDDLFLDVGAGDGALASRLAPSVSQLLAIEIDADCIPHLEGVLAGYDTANVIEGDILQLDLQELVAPHLHSGRKLRIAGNLPYNIATAIIDRLLHIELPIEDMVFMVQLEVAQRITASPGTKQYGFLSVDCQHHSEVRFGFKVSPACFAPRPQVSSAIVSFKPKPSALMSELETDFEALCKAAFSHRRKTLENSLTRHPIFGKIAHLLLTRAGISGSRRAEQLTVQEYECLAKTYAALRIDDDK